MVHTVFTRLYGAESVILALNNCVAQLVAIAVLEGGPAGADEHRISVAGWAVHFGAGRRGSQRHADPGQAGANLSIGTRDYCTWRHIIRAQAEVRLVQALDIVILASIARRSGQYNG